MPSVFNDVVLLALVQRTGSNHHLPHTVLFSTVFDQLFQPSAEIMLDLFFFGLCRHGRAVARPALHWEAARLIRVIPYCRECHKENHSLV